RARSSTWFLSSDTARRSSSLTTTDRGTHVAFVGSAGDDLLTVVPCSPVRRRSLFQAAPPGGVLRCRPKLPAHAGVDGVSVRGCPSVGRSRGCRRAAG